MKLITAIVQDKDANSLSNTLTENDIRATRLASSGSFLRSGNTTFMIAVEEERIETVLDIIKNRAHARKTVMTPPLSVEMALGENHAPMEIEVGGATVFIQNIENFYRF